MEEIKEDIEIRGATGSLSAIQQYQEGVNQLPKVLKHLGYDDMRPGQDRAVHSVMTQRDSVVILPTSTGKSACFKIPALAMNWRTIIIYPLVALMRDQVQAMQREGLAAASISSQETDAHNASVLREWVSKELQFMLVSPERFANAVWAETVRQSPPDFVAMDEAHTFASWADSFRPGYKFAGKFIQEVQPKVVAAYSATLVKEDEDELREGLGMQQAQLVYHYPPRENLHLRTIPWNEVTGGSSNAVPNVEECASWVAHNCEGPTVVFASTRKNVELYASLIDGFTYGGRVVLFYHGGMKQSDRKHQQDTFMQASDAIIVATNAFGMGVDKPDIRNVVHLDIPGDVRALAQEVGRAGRDGKDSDCCIIYRPESKRTQEHFIRCGNPTENDITQFYKAALNHQTRPGGPITCKRSDIARTANTDNFATGAIMSFCLGEGVFEYDTTAVNKARVQFANNIPSMTLTQRKTRDALWDVSIEKDDGYLHFDVEALAEQLPGTQVSTIYSRLNAMQKAGLLTWVRATTGKPIRVATRIEDIPRSSFERMDAKAKEAIVDLSTVIDYIHTEDEDKQQFLSDKLSR